MSEIEPTAADLAAIEEEWPLIAAGLELLAVEIGILTSSHDLTDLDWRRWRAAVRRVSEEGRAFYNRPCRCLCLDEVAMSDCAVGCKVYTCRRHGHPRVIHSETYGCRTVVRSRAA